MDGQITEVDADRNPVVFPEKTFSLEPLAQFCRDGNPIMDMLIELTATAQHLAAAERLTSANITTEQKNKSPTVQEFFKK